MTNIHSIISNISNDVANWHVVETLQVNQTIQPVVNKEGHCQFKAVSYESKWWFNMRMAANSFADTKSLGYGQSVCFQSFNREINETLKNVKELKSTIQLGNESLTENETIMVSKLLTDLKDTVTKVLRATYPLLAETYKDRTVIQEAQTMSGEKKLIPFSIDKELDLEAYILANELLPEIENVLSKDPIENNAEQMRKNIDDALEFSLTSTSDNSLSIDMRHNMWLNHPSSLVDLEAPSKLRRNYYENFNDDFGDLGKMDSKNRVRDLLLESIENKPYEIMFDTGQTLEVPEQFYLDIDRMNLYCVNGKILYDLDDQHDPRPSRDVIVSSVYENIVQEILKKYCSLEAMVSSTSSASMNNNESLTSIQGVDNLLIQDVEETKKLATLIARLSTQRLFGDVGELAMVIYSPHQNLLILTGCDKMYEITLEKEQILITGKLCGRLASAKNPLESSGYFLFKRVITLPIKESLQVDLSNPDLKNSIPSVKCKDVFSKKLEDADLSKDVPSGNENGFFNESVNKKLADLLKIF